MILFVLQTSDMFAKVNSEKDKLSAGFNVIRGHRSFFNTNSDIIFVSVIALHVVIVACSEPGCV